MNYLTVENVTKSYGEKILFDQISFGIEKGQKIALIAKNGVGKSTLLNIIAGIETPDSGLVTTRKDITIAYLPQLNALEAEQSVLDLILDSQNPSIVAVKEYEVCLALIKKQQDQQLPVPKELSERMEKSLLEVERLHAWDIESRVKEVLSKFGINNIFQDINELSGGQKKKVALAKTLIHDSDLLILDEPTNHLDIDMIEWLEEYLSNNNITLLMVTHDRYFLDQVCNYIIELDRSKLYQYKGKYDYYLEKKAERLANEAVTLERIRQLYRNELAWVKTSPQARTTKAKARIKSFEVLKEEAHQKVEKQQEGFFIQSERLGNKILEINNLHFSYPDKELIRDFSYTFKKGEKCGIVGKNGTGKSTLLKLIMEELKPDAGKITPGLTVQFGYFSQDNLKVEGNKRMIDIVKEHAEVVRLQSGNYVGASQFLSYFGFSYEQQYTYFEDLSGGEKRKLHLLITLIKNPNFLLLDEPTNDFDIDTLNLLEEFLDHFQGVVLVVSHDRWFMNKLVDHIFVFEGEGKIKDYYGNYTEYRLEREKQEKARKRAEKQRRESEIRQEETNVDVPPIIKSQKRTYKENREFEALEVEIELLEKEKEDLLERMNSGNATALELTEWSTRYGELEEELDEKMMRWLELSEKEE